MYWAEKDGIRMTISDNKRTHYENMGYKITPYILIVPMEEIKKPKTNKPGEP